MKSKYHQHRCGECGLPIIERESSATFIKRKLFRKPVSIRYHHACVLKKGRK